MRGQSVADERPRIKRQVKSGEQDDAYDSDDYADPHLAREVDAAGPAIRAAHTGWVPPAPSRMRPR